MRVEFPANITKIYSCGTCVIVALRGWTIDNSPTPLCDRVMEETLRDRVMEENTEK